jgi:hypothetical protein
MRTLISFILIPLHYPNYSVFKCPHKIAKTMLAPSTPLDGGGAFSCVWMNNNCNISNPVYWNGAGESLNLAVNALTDVLHTLYVNANPQSTPTTSPSSTSSPTLTPTTIPPSTLMASPSPSPTSSPPSTPLPTSTSSPTSSPSPSPTASPSGEPTATGNQQLENSPNQSNYMYRIVAIATVSSVVAVVLIVLKKRKHEKTS